MPQEEDAVGAPRPVPPFQPGQAHGDAEAERDQRAGEGLRGDLGQRAVEEQQAARQHPDRMVMKIVQMGTDAEHHPLGLRAGQHRGAPQMSRQQQYEIADGDRATGDIGAQGAGRTTHHGVIKTRRFRAEHAP
uniref:Uncharacterized protein n=1 Tax=Streptomyces auratus AGR0001 TaxID=1160718 RepID=J1ZSF6_9ACTN